MSLTNIPLKAMLFGLLIFFCSSSIFAQKSKKERQKERITEVQNLLSSGSFKFVAQNASPMRGGGYIPLTSSYDLMISKDKIESYLPYFGRAFSAPMNPSEGGIKFSSGNFKMDVTKKKKGRQDFIISFKDVPQVRQMILSVSETGNATLLVLSNNRDPITFDGYISSAKK